MSLRNDWTREEIQTLYDQPFLDLVFDAQSVHRQHFPANIIQVSTLLSIKTGKCPEDCKYCSQSVHYDSKLEAEKRIAVETEFVKPKLPKTLVLLGFVWAQHGEIHMSAICLMC